MSNRAFLCRTFFFVSNECYNGGSPLISKVFDAQFDTTVILETEFHENNVFIPHTDKHTRYWKIVPTHYDDVIMSAIASQITSLTIVNSTVYPGADQRKHQSSASLAFVWGTHRNRWISHTKGQLRGKCLHFMTSSWINVTYAPIQINWARNIASYSFSQQPASSFTTVSNVMVLLCDVRHQ